VLRQYELALKDAEALIAMDATRSESWFVKAEALMGLRRNGELAAVVAGAMKPVSETASDSAMAEAMFYLYAGERERARKLVDGWVSQRPDPDAYVLRAELRDARAEALADLRVALKSAGRPGRLHYSAVELMLLRKWHREALETLADVEKAAGATLESAMMRAVAHWQAGNKEASAAAFTEVKQLIQSPSQLNNICWGLATLGGELDAALQICDEAIAKLPECAPCIDSRGFVLLRMGRFQEAVDSYNTSLLKRPMMAASLYGRGVARLRMGQAQEGDLDLRLARAVAPMIALEMERYGLKP
jgi:tetratricopeptide (TPR) repeat protein